MSNVRSSDPRPGDLIKILELDADYPSPFTGCRALVRHVYHHKRAFVISATVLPEDVTEALQRMAQRAPDGSYQILLDRSEFDIMQRSVY